MLSDSALAQSLHTLSLSSPLTISSVTINQLSQFRKAMEVCMYMHLLTGGGRGSEGVSKGIPPPNDGILEQQGSVHGSEAH